MARRQMLDIGRSRHRRRRFFPLLKRKIVAAGVSGKGHGASRNADPETNLMLGTGTAQVFCRPARVISSFAESAMADIPEQTGHNSNDFLHSVVYRAIIILAAGFVLAAWGFSADRGYIRLALAVVTGLVVVVVTIASVLARISRHNGNRGAGEASKAPASFHDWLRGEFGTSNGDVRASVAAVEILLPIVAAVIGMTAFAIVRGIVAG
jgi:hypothetical protein